jgi:hypothetical protein
MVGNTTLLIGSDDESVSHVKEIIRLNAQTRKHVRPTTMSFGVGLHDSEPESEVSVGGASVLVVGVAKWRNINVKAYRFTAADWLCGGCFSFSCNPLIKLLILSRSLLTNGNKKPIIVDEV